MITLEEIQSPFQMNGCIIQKMEINNEFVFLPTDVQLVSSVNIKNALSDIIKAEETGILQAHLILDLEYKAEYDGKVFSIHIVLDGLFSTTDSDENRFHQMLLLNGNSALYSIARSHIITISGMSLTSGQLILPMINFVNLMHAASNENKK